MSITCALLAQIPSSRTASPKLPPIYWNAASVASLGCIFDHPYFPTPEGGRPSHFAPAEMLLASHYLLRVRPWWFPPAVHILLFSSAFALWELPFSELCLYTSAIDPGHLGNTPTSIRLTLKFLIQAGLRLPPLFLPCLSSISERDRLGRLSHHKQPPYNPRLRILLGSTRPPPLKRKVANPNGVNKTQHSKPKPYTL